MLNNKDFDHTFKILLVGDSGVGKSSILLRFTDDDFQEDHPCTIGKTIMKKKKKILKIKFYFFSQFFFSFF